MKALPAMSFKPSPTRSRRSVECRRLTAHACGSDLNSASPLPAWRQTMFECINSCSTAPEQTDIDVHRWRRLQPHDKQRRAGPRVAVFQAEGVSAFTSSVALLMVGIRLRDATACSRAAFPLRLIGRKIREAQVCFGWDTN